MQLALQPRHAQPRPERPGQSGGDHGFSEILQVEPGKRAAAGDRASAVDDGQATSPFHLSIGRHRLADRLPAATASEKVLERESRGEDVAEEDATLPESALVDLGATEPEEEIAIQSGAQQTEAGPALPLWATGTAAASQASAQATQTLAAVSVAHPEQAIRTGRSQSSTVNGPDIAEGTAPAAGFQRGERPAPGQVDPTPATSSPTAGGGFKDAGTAEAAAREAATGSTDRPERNAEPRVAPPTSAGEGRADKPQFPASMRVMEAQSIPAPASHPAATVVNAVSAAPDWMSLARSAGAAPATATPAAAGPMKTLTIQLHPAELGVVTARLQFADDQLSIELQVDKAEAYDRLSTDRDAILKAVRALGIEVDKVTVQQSQAQAAAAPRGENNAAFNGGNGREAGFSAPGGSGGGEGGRDGHSAPNRHDESPNPAGVTRGGQSPDQRGLYI